MTSCAIKVCRNYKGRLNASNNISYHRIPSNPIIRSQWVNNIRKSRGEELWQPSKNTQLCSEHFDEKDVYYANSQGRRRLKKGAIPKKAMFLSSIQSVKSETSEEDANLTEQNIGRDDSIKDPDKLYKSETQDIPIQPSTSKLSNDDLSDLESIFDTPKEVKLKQELRRKNIIQKKQSLKIQSLRRKNQRLQNKLRSYKNILKTLKEDIKKRERH